MKELTAKAVSGLALTPAHQEPVLECQASSEPKAGGTQLSARAQTVLNRVVSAINEQSPEGLGDWWSIPGVDAPTDADVHPCWKAVYASTDAFFDALTLWERDDTADNRVALQDATRAFVRAWSSAGEAYRLEFMAGGEDGPRQSNMVAAHV